MPWDVVFSSFFIERTRTHRPLPFSSIQFANKQDTELRRTRRPLRELNAEILNVFIEIFDFKDYESKQRGINYDTFLHYYFLQAPQVSH